MRYVNTRVSLLISPSEILDNPPVRIDLIVLCDLVERLSGLFIIAERFSHGNEVLHNVTMPRSWFINLVHPDTDPKRDLEKDTSAFSEFASTIIELMQRIDAQVQWYIFTPEIGGQFIADGSRITNITGPLYIARM
jgi:hypothetical protein